MLIGYARVSTEDQHLDLQQDALAQAGCRRVFVDRRSGAKADRPGLLAALGYVRPGDCVAVWRLDRLGRSLPNLIALVRRMEEAGIQLRSLTEGIDTSTANGRLTFHLFASLAEFERALVRERTRAGLEAARARKGRRKHRLTPERRAHAVDLYRAKDKTVREICQLMAARSLTAPRPARRAATCTIAADGVRLRPTINRRFDGDIPMLADPAPWIAPVLK